MVQYFLDFMLYIFQHCFTNYVFLLPLGFITLYITLQLFRKMGGKA